MAVATGAFSASTSSPSRTDTGVCRLAPVCHFRRRPRRLERVPSARLWLAARQRSRSRPCAVRPTRSGLGSARFASPRRLATQAEQRRRVLAGDQGAFVFVDWCSSEGAHLPARAEQREVAAEQNPFRAEQVGGVTVDRRFV